MITATYFQLDNLAPDTFMEHVGEISPLGTTVGALFGTAILRKPLEKAGMTVVLSNDHSKLRGGDRDRAWRRSDR